MAPLYLFLCFCLFQALPIFANKTLKKCSLSFPVLMEIEKRFDVQIDGLHYSIFYDYMDKIVTDFPSEHQSQIYFGSTDVNITGHFYTKEKYADFKMASKLSTGSFTVNRTVENPGSLNEKITCKVVEAKRLLEGIHRAKDSMSQKERAKFTVYALIVGCLEVQICEQYSAIATHDFLTRTKLEKSIDEQIAAYYKQKKAKEEPIQKEKSLQATLNWAFDFSVSCGISRWTDDKGIFHVPHIQKNFSYLTISGNFMADDITFEGLTNLKRTADISLTNDRNRFTMGTTAKLSKSKVTIPAYVLKYGFKTVKGHLIVVIEDLSLAIQVSVDYNAAPCKVHLDEMKIHEMGNVNVDFSGLGGLFDKLAIQPLIRYAIENYIPESGRKMIAEQASKLNCEI